MASWTPPVAPATRAPGAGRGWAVLLIGAGGAVGTMLRATLELTFPAAPGGWPWTTFGINIAGAFLLAVLLEAIAVLGRDEGWLRGVRLGVGTGLLGGFTTYSAFMVETLQLGDTAGYLVAFGYVAASLVLGFMAAWAGTVGVSALHRTHRWQR